MNIFNRNRLKPDATPTIFDKSTNEDARNKSKRKASTDNPNEDVSSGITGVSPKKCPKLVRNDSIDSINKDSNSCEKGVQVAVSSSRKSKSVKPEAVLEKSTGKINQTSLKSRSESTQTNSDIRPIPVTNKVNKAVQSNVNSRDKNCQTSASVKCDKNCQTSSRMIKRDKNCQTQPSTRLLTAQRTSKIRLKHLRKLQMRYNDLEKDYKKLKRDKFKTKKEQVIDYINQNFPPDSAQFINSQVRMIGKKKKGERYTDKDKEIALSLLYVSANCYKLLRKIFRLPDKSTLRRWLKDIPTTAGISEFLLAALKKKASEMTTSERLCSLVLDEIKLSPGLRYDRYNDIVDGFEDFGEFGRTVHAADHALVLMVRGIKLTYKQTIGYYLAQSSVNGVLLKEIILNAMSKLFIQYFIT